MAKWIEIVRAPRFAKVPTFIRDTAFVLGLDLSIEVEKHFFRETVRFSVEGDENMIATFRLRLSAALAEYNAR